ncbi:MAG: hypothetical protein WBN65_08395 [Gammaproteobacteria bacterium]
MLPEARLVHAIPGRMRLRLPAMRGDDPYFHSLREALLEQAPGAEVSVSPGTASLLVEDTGLRPRDLARLAREHGWFTLIRKPGTRPDRPTSSARLTDLLDASRATPSLVAILVALAILQVARGQVMVPALSLLWIAFELVRRQGAWSRYPETSRTPSDQALH